MNKLPRGVNTRLGSLIQGLLLLVLFGLLVVSACIPSAQDIITDQQSGLPTLPAPEVGRLAPDFTLIDLEGNSVTLSDFRGKVIFINFWASWCPPCRAEMPEIEAVYQEYKSKDVVFIGIDLLETENEVRQLVEEGGFSWTFVIDTTDEVGMNYGITVIPTTFFVDKKGIIRAVNIGAMTKRMIESQIAEIMK